MTPEMMSAILGTGGIVGALVVIVPKLLDGIQAMRSGRAAREREHNRGLIRQVERAERERDHAEQERDEARAQRDAAEVKEEERARDARILAEYASALRRQLIDRGASVEEIPQWPTRDE